MGGRKQALADRLNRMIGHRTGFWLTPVRPGLPDVVVDDPRWFSYREAPSGSGVAIAAAVAQGSLHMFGLGPDSYHPWVVALRRAAAGGPSAVNEVRRVLAAYYSLVQPSSPAEWLDISPAACAPVSRLPAVATVMPWGVTSPQQAMEDARMRAARERRGYGLAAAERLGSPSFGPLADVQIEAEARKLWSLRSILAEQRLDSGRPDYDAGAVFLVSGEEMRWLCTAGRHRVATMVALGADELPLTVRVVVRRDEVEHWPQVRAGTIERRAALDVFDRVMSGTPSRIVRSWQSWVDETG
jgi:hypothetical protein